MARLKRLTRVQKQLLTKIKGGKQPSPDSDGMADLDVLQKHGLLTLELGRWQPTDKALAPEPVAVSAEQLEQLREKFS